MAKLIVELPDQLHAQLKQQAAVAHQTLRVIVTSLLQEYLHHPSRAAGKGSTRLCGAWKDSRSAGQLMAEIRSARRWRMIGRR